MFSVQRSAFNEMILLLSLLLGEFTPKQQLDLNSATLAQIESLPIDPEVARGIFRLREERGAFKSIYELRRVVGLSPRDFERIKPLIRLTPVPVRREELRWVHAVQRELAAEEAPSEAAIEEWQDLVISPLNINKASVDELAALPNVSLIDAVAVVSHTQAKREIRGLRDLRSSVVGLSDYGYRNMRNYVTFRDPPAAGLDGNWRINYDYDEERPVESKQAALEQNLEELAQRARFRDAGFSDAEIDHFEQRLRSEQAYLARYQTRSALRNRFRGRMGEHLRVGFWVNKDFSRPGTVSDFKGCAGLYDLAPLCKVFVGDYRVTVGQGLMIDNAPSLSMRFHDRTQGLYNDLTPENRFGFRGAGTQVQLPWLGGTIFYSRNARDGIANPDGTINCYAYTDPILPTNRGNFLETNVGGSARLELGSLGFLSPGSYVALNGLVAGYDKTFVPDAKWIDLPGDNVLLTDANYTQLSRGRSRRFLGLDFRTTVNNLSLEGEISRQDQGGLAYLVKGRAQYNYLYLVALVRHYDANYDSPYNRGFAEQRRFDDTPFEKSYRLIDPVLVDMVNLPVPKAEEGVYAEMRYQISRSLTLTRTYVDVWRNLATGANNWRFQGEMEYRPVFPLRLRLRQKLQEKHLAKDVMPTRSFTHETSLRSLVSLSNYDFLTAEARFGRVLLTPSLAYNGNEVIGGDFLSVAWEHNFSDDFALETGLAVWRTNGMSQWIPEDVGIDFLDGQGVKYYIAGSDRLSSFCLLKVKLRQRFTEFPFTGLGGPESGLHFSEPGGPAITDFTARKRSFDISVQLDFLW